jgi:polyphosphate:AMP phosphotransferase
MSEQVPTYKENTMFESAELGHQIAKADYDKEVPILRADLLDAQYDMGMAKKFPVIILVDGLEGAGKSEVVNLLNAWMDPRHILTHGFDRPSDEQRERPRMWRYWKALPPKGKIAFLFQNWYAAPLESGLSLKAKASRLEQRLAEINRFERMLAEEGALLLKFWFHLSKDGQKKRLKALEKSPLTRWRVPPEAWEQYENYEVFIDTAERILRRTSTAHAPWIVIDGSDDRFRALSAGRILLDAIRKRLELAKKDYKPRSASAPLPPVLDNRDVLNALDLTQRLAKKRYVEELETWQGRLNQLSRDKRFRERALVLVFEGVDAAGKGSAIRRLTGALDARQYRVVPVAAPTEEEKAQPYLWRFWRHLPRLGGITFFDRSWYGRVLVERVEGFCAEPEWMRAYGEINDFEDQLTSRGIIVAKFWMHISQEEQLRRFKEREDTRFKRFKITPEDWRNRERWPEYQRAVCDMVDRTSTDHAPWTLVEAEDKYFARVKVLKSLCQRLALAMD